MLTIPDLSAVPIFFEHLFAIKILISSDVDPDVVASFIGQLFHKSLPHPPPLLWCKLGIVELDVDPRDEGIIKSPNPVRGKEQYPVVKLQSP